MALARSCFFFFLNFGLNNIMAEEFRLISDSNNFYIDTDAPPTACITDRRARHLPRRASERVRRDASQAAAGSNGTFVTLSTLCATRLCPSSLSSLQNSKSQKILKSRGSASPTSSFEKNAILRERARSHAVTVNADVSRSRHSHILCRVVTAARARADTITTDTGATTPHVYRCKKKHSPPRQVGIVHDKKMYRHEKTQL